MIAYRTNIETERQRGYFMMPKIEPIDYRSKITKEIGIRGNTNRQRLVDFLHQNLGMSIELPKVLRAVYGSMNLENVNALAMVTKSARKQIKASGINLEIRREENRSGVVTLGLYPKR